MKQFILKSIIFFGLFLALSSCTGTKKISEKNSETKIKELSEKTTDKVSDTKTNKEINDNISVPLRSNNEEVNKAIRDAFRDFNFNKQSGTNSTQFIFDEEAMAFKIANIIGATQDKNTSSVIDTKTDKSFEQTTDEYFSKKISQIPWWLWVVAIIYLMPRIVEGVSAIYNPFSLLIKKIKTK
ncbi:hypothetical protein G6N05_05425 [Flavobacterium sp. F372]|uniref:Lipoprotein n=1 Tax=Flavobacterium bernardetii TaxID=2813823 RepID=A0ABR7J175_9FLAO|nr:hypothetical protein [Flavobacterium bernardetii]MBC5835821.1 hypothetical protein [Flavobacterium bernardetii]NHF69551.1 hypothetical protein [Flavobacterium bernardetii]